MGEVHRDMVDNQGLRNRHFDLIKSHLAETLTEMGVKQVGQFLQKIPCSFY